MKKLITIIFILTINLTFAQRVEKEFQFNSKKFIKEYQKSVKATKIKTYQLTIVDLQGKDIIFDVFETQISEEKIPNLYTFKGKSKNGNNIISFTISKAGLTGSYSDNGQEIYIEPVAKSCRKHIVYSQSNNRSDGQIGQINDHVQ